jgi:TfoX/Sxy family transcriptional regulator of competence genes
MLCLIINENEIQIRKVHKTDTKSVFELMLPGGLVSIKKMMTGYPLVIK